MSPCAGLSYFSYGLKSCKSPMLGKVLFLVSVVGKPAFVVSPALFWVRHTYTKMFDLALALDDHQVADGRVCLRGIQLSRQQKCAYLSSLLTVKPAAAAQAVRQQAIPHHRYPPPLDRA